MLPDQSHDILPGEDTNFRKLWFLRICLCLLFGMIITLAFVYLV